MTEKTALTEPQAHTVEPSASTATRDPVGRLTMAAIVAFFVVAGHIGSIDTGLWLDDHAHYAQLRHFDWSLRSAVKAAELGVVGQVLDLWGSRESGLRFFRPIAFWIMKAEYAIGGSKPMAMHGFSLGWHFACSMLVGALAMRCFGRRLWATVAASLMAIHPAHVATVYWVACQTELMATAFLLLGVLAYSRHAGWGRRMFVRPSERSAPPDHHAPPTGPEPRTITPAGIAAVICYGLGLGCRENAILFPLVCWAGDRLLGTTRRRRIRWEHVAMACVVAVYLGLRYVMLEGFPVPARPYLMPVWDPAFPGYLVEKTVIYALALFAYVPVVPMGGRVFFASRAGAFYGGFAVTVAILLVIWWAYRFRRELIWPVVWIACMIAPVLPVFASSHHLYLPSVGMTLIIGAGLAALGGVLALSAKRPAPVRALACGLLLALHVLGLGTLTWASGFAYTRGTLTEDIIVEDVIGRGRPIRDGDHLFFVNLPPVAYYAVQAIKTKLGLTELHGHVLTCSPQLMRMESPGELEILDAHRLRVRSPEQARYFGGVTGTSLLQMMGLDGMPAQGDVIDAGLFTVVPTLTDDRGIRELLFTFRRPLASPDYHFFFGSPQFLAYPVDMSRHLAAATQPAAKNGELRIEN